MSEKITVKLEGRSYDIVIGNDMPVAGTISGTDGLTALVISDSNVAPLYAQKCEDALKKQGLTVLHSQISAGEGSKSSGSVSELHTAAIKAGLDRRSIIVALGGGVVGDLAGFVAATFLRGVRYIQVPTTVLAMVDSSVGGKTGINLPEGKNLVGSFHQPIEVVIDLSTLKTLPEKEYLSGLAEVVKYGVIWDASFFDMLEREVEAILGRDDKLLASVVKRCCEIKAEVVASDEKESGLRTILNFGHTLGHALENVMGYGACTHGDAVSVGMVYAAKLSVTEGGFTEEESCRVNSLLAKLGLPVSVKEINGGKDLEWSDLRKAMGSDKKAEGSVPRWVLAEGMGKVRFGAEVNEEVMESVL